MNSAAQITEQSQHSVKGDEVGIPQKTNKHPKSTLPWLNKSWVMLNEVISSGDFCRSGWFLFLQEKSHRDNGNCSFANGLINTPTGRYCCEGNDSEITKPTIDLIRVEKKQVRNKKKRCAHAGGFQFGGFRCPTCKAAELTKKINKKTTTKITGKFKCVHIALANAPMKKKRAKQSIYYIIWTWNTSMNSDFLKKCN